MMAPNSTFAVVLPVGNGTDRMSPDESPAALAIPRLTMWASSYVALFLDVASRSRSGTNRSLETLCWRPTGASLRGAALQVRALRAPPPHSTDTVTWSVVLQHPVPAANGTQPSWVPGGVGPYVDIALLLEVEFECGAGDPRAEGGAAVSRRSIVVPVPVAGIPQQLAAEVRASARSVQFGAALAASGGGTAVGRVLATRAVVLCSSGDAAATASGGPLGLVVPSDGCDANSAVPIYRGTVAGNALLLGAGAALAVVCAAAVGCVRHTGVLAALRRVAFPSWLQPAWVVVIPSTVTATAQIAAASSGL
jgi:hypothetical protein